MTNHFEVNMDEYLPLRDVVFKTLRQAILKGELEPGERLMEIQLAERLGVSRTPIREAIRKLELEGLVLMIPRKGAEVAKISESNLRDVLEVRRSLEELAIDLACQRITAEELESLNKAEVDFKAAIGNGDAMQIAQTDEQFHEIIYNSTKNQKLVQILNNLREQMYRYRLEYIKDADKRQILMVEHEHILKALTLRHIQEAKMAVREHIDNQEITILKNLKEQENDKEKYQAGEIEFEAIDDYVDEWNNSDDERTLAKFLGLNADEEDAWIDDGDEALKEMLDAGKQ